MRNVPVEQIPGVTQILTPVLTLCNPMHACYLSMRFRCVFTIGILLVCDLLNAIYELYVIREWSIKPTTQILLTSQCE